MAIFVYANAIDCCQPSANLSMMALINNNNDNQDNNNFNHLVPSLPLPQRMWAVWSLNLNAIIRGCPSIQPTKKLSQHQ